MRSIDLCRKLIRNSVRRIGYDIHRIEPDMVDIVVRLSNENSIKTILDVGANIGQTAISYSERFPEAMIHSIEPYSKAYSILSKNCTSLPNVNPHNIALGANNETKPLFLNRESVTNSLLENSPTIVDFSPDGYCEPIGRESVTVRDLASFCNDQNISSIDLLKMDTQGYELSILQGANDMLDTKTIRFIYLEVLFVPLYAGQSYFDEILNYLRGKNYQFYNFFEFSLDKERGMKWANALFL